MNWKIVQGDCIEVMKAMDECSVDSIVTDPPYGLRFMGKKWDYDVPETAVWAECLRVLKPGGHLLAFGGTRTIHRLVCNIEDAGFEIRDMIAWVYGSGFPKSLDVSKAIDKAAGAEREVVGSYTVGDTAAKGKHKGRAAAASDEGSAIGCSKELAITAPATDAARQWQGWGTALKPALEPITMARKPLIGTVAENVLEHGTGGLNVDGCRVASPDNPTALRRSYGYSANTEKAADSEARGALRDRSDPAKRAAPHPSDNLGRWPANLIHDGSDEVVSLFPSSRAGRESQERGVGGIWSGVSTTPCGPQYGDSGSAARFFYCAKASSSERGEGNIHPTVKPIALMRYLCRLVTPEGGIVLDPFAGSGTTILAAKDEGFGAIGIELNHEYAEIAIRRMESRIPSLGL